MGPARTLHALLVGLAVVAAVLLGTATTAGAHAEIRESEPDADGVVAEGIEEISMRFISLDPSGPVTAQIFDADGDDVTTSEPEVRARDSFVTVATEPLTPGIYTVRWSALSDDGDGISEGGFSFTVEEGPGGSAWLVWAFALAIPAAFLLGPRLRRRSPG